MKLNSFHFLLLATSALAACQVTPADQTPRHDADEAANPSRSTAVAPASSSSSSYAAPATSDRLTQEPMSTTSRDTWGPGVTHISLGGAYVEDETSDEPGDPGDDIETLDLNAAIGRLLTERLEINVQASYHESDIGVDDVNRTGLFGGLRYHLLVPTAEQDLGIYAEGMAGVISIDSPSRDGEDFAYGASTGILWFPFGFESGMAFDVSVDWLESDQVDRLGASLGLAYYW